MESGRGADGARSVCAMSQMLQARRFTLALLLLQLPADQTASVVTVATGRELPFPLERTRGGWAHSTTINITQPPYHAVGDNETDNSAAFDRALKSIGAAGGGTLVVPAGTFRTGPITLVSNMTLEVQGTVAAFCNLSWSDELAALPGQTPWTGLTGGLVNGINVSDVEISGDGTIDGCGSVFWRARAGNTSADRAWKSKSAAEAGSGNRPFIVRLENSQRLHVAGITLRNAPMFTLVPIGCSDVHIEHIAIFNPSGGHGYCYEPNGWAPGEPYDGENLANCCAPNTDGIDIVSSRRVLIEHSTISTGDDAVCMKTRPYGNSTYYPVPTRDVLVRNMDIKAASCPTRGSDGVGALKLGTDLVGGVENVIFEDSRVGRAGYALKVDSPFGQGGFARNVTWRNITIDEAEQAIYINAAAYTAKPNAPPSSPHQHLAVLALPPPPAAPPPGTCNVTVQVHLSNAYCIYNQTFGCFDNGSMWAMRCSSLFVCNGVRDVYCNGGYFSTKICDCKMATPDVFITASDLHFKDIVGRKIGEPKEGGPGHVVPAGVNSIRAGAPAGATGITFHNISLSNDYSNVSWQVSRIHGYEDQVSPPLQLNGSGIAGGQMQCADLSSKEQTLSSYWGSHHFMHYDPSQLGIPALGWRVYSDHSLDLHHGEGLWLHLLRLGARHPGGESYSAVMDAEYSWRPDFVEQTGSVQGLSVKQRVYYSAMDAIEADIEVTWTSGQLELELDGIPNPANTYARTSLLPRHGSTVRLAVSLATNLTHGLGGTAAGCIAAGICTPITVHAVVSVSVLDCGLESPETCGELGVRSVCASPTPAPPASQCDLDHQDSHAPCILNTSFGCYSNKTMWVANGHCRGEFSCSGVHGVSCPGTGKSIGHRTHCDCLPAPPTRSCNYTFGFNKSETLASSQPVRLHASFEIVNASTMAALLDVTMTSDRVDGSSFLSEVRGVNQTTKTINAWLAQAKPLPSDNTFSPRERLTYYRAWLNYWQQVQLGVGNISGLPVLCSSKDEYGRFNGLWDTAFHVIGLLEGGSSALQLARAQITEYVRSAQVLGHLPGGMETDRGVGMQVPGALTWAAMMLYEREPDNDFLAAIYPAFAENNRWWYDPANHANPIGDGLCQWWSLISGWDNSPRWDTGSVEAVDLNSWLCLDQQTLARMATLLRKPTSEINGWWRKANHTAKMVQERLWDEEAGVFFDWNPKLNRSVAVITPATYFTLLPGIATPEQARRMAHQLSNHSSLLTPYPLPVVSNSAPSYNASWYWRGPVWININWITIYGLQRYGLEQEAAELRRKTIALVAKTDVLREYYNSQTGEGEGAKNFMWTAALYVAMALQEPRP